jgi:6-phosphogluconolactonase
MFIRRSLPHLLGLLLAGQSLAAAPGRVYFGTYTSKGSRGIYTATFDPATGKLGRAELAAESPEPSFLAVARDGKHLYAVNETGTFEGGATGAVRAFTVTPSGSLELLNQVPSAGADPCNLVLTPDGGGLLVSNYSGGSLALLPVGCDGRLGPARAVVQHQGPGVDSGQGTAPHVHSATFIPGTRTAWVADLGLDRVFSYRVDAGDRALTPAAPPFLRLAPGAGPRHLALGPGGKRIYVVNELNSTITVFARGRELQTLSTLPAGFKGHNDCADIHMHPSGRFLYASNRGHDSLGVFKVDARGRLTLLENVATGGRTPRNFALAPDGRFLYAENQDSGTVVTFAVDPASGRLTATGQVLEVPAPVCMVFLP